MQNVLKKIAQYRTISILFCISTSIVVAKPGVANITPDTTIPTPSSIVNSSPQSSTPVLSIEGGSRPGQGSNLFHSFSEFSVLRNQTVNFFIPPGIERIFSRVTGTRRSRILGILGMTGGIADLFFINPHGILFGKNAKLNFSGSAIFSTADAIQFQDNNLFSSITPNESVLLSISPNAFLFNSLADNQLRGIIINQSNEIIDNEDIDIQTGLAVPSGKTLGLLGGQIRMNNGIIDATDGHLEIGSVFDESTVFLEENNEQYIFKYDLSLISRFEDILFRNISQITNYGNGDETIRIRGNQISFSQDSRIDHTIEGTRQEEAGFIRIEADRALHLARNTTIGATVTQSGYGPEINIQTRQLTLTQGGEIISDTRGPGFGGDIRIVAENITLSGASRLSGASAIQALVSSQSTGEGGTIWIHTDSLSVQDRAVISTTFSGSDGQGGDLNISATESVRVSDDRSSLRTGVSRGVKQGRGGDFYLSTRQLLIDNEGLISTSIVDSDDDGTIISTAETGSLTIDADEIQIVGTGPSEGWLTLVQADNVQNSNEAVTQASDRHTRIRNLNQSFENPQSTGSSNTRLTGILSETNPGNRGNAGSITITANALRILNGGGIAATAQAEQGNGGDITINVATLILENGNLLTTTRRTDGGNIDLNVSNLLILQDDSRISTSAGIAGDTEGDNAGGTGGDIRISSNLLAALPQTNSDITANAFGGEGGTVDINAQSVFGFIARSRNNLQQELGTNDPNQLDPDNLQTNDITAISQVNPNLNGEIIITTNSDPSRTEKLPSDLVDASNQIQQSLCRETQGSAFVLAGQGGVSPSPRNPFQSDDVWEDWRLTTLSESSHNSLPLSSTTTTVNTTLETSSSGRASQISSPVSRQLFGSDLVHASSTFVEAKGWQISPDGKVILVADTSVHHLTTSADSETSGELETETVRALEAIAPFPSTTCQT